MKIPENTKDEEKGECDCVSVSETKETDANCICIHGCNCGVPLQILFRVSTIWTDLYLQYCLFTPFRIFNAENISLLSLKTPSKVDVSNGKWCKTRSIEAVLMENEDTFSALEMEKGVHKNTDSIILYEFERKYNQQKQINILPFILILFFTSMGVVWCCHLLPI
jgi:hypothetical protein